LRQETEFEIVSGALNSIEENPLQKFQRLQYETKKLMEELQDKKAEIPKEKKEGVSPAALKDEVVILQNQLTELLKDERYQQLLNPKYEVEHSATVQQGLTKKLLAELSALSKGKGEAKDSKGQVTYELYYTPDKSKYLQMSKFADIERRIAELEKVLGTNQSFPILESPVLNLVDSLRGEVTSLTPSNLDALQRKLSIVSQELNEVLSKHESLSPNGQDQQISEIYEMMKKWDSVSSSLPSLVARLNTLKSLHEQSASFVSSLQQLDSHQTELKTLLKSDQELLSQLDKNFQENFTTIQSNFSNLEKRFGALSKKMEELGMESY